MSAPRSQPLGPDPSVGVRPAGASPSPWAPPALPLPTPPSILGLVSAFVPTVSLSNRRGFQQRAVTWMVAVGSSKSCFYNKPK